MLLPLNMRYMQHILPKDYEWDQGAIRVSPESWKVSMVFNSRNSMIDALFKMDAMKRPGLSPVFFISIVIEYLNHF